CWPIDGVRGAKPTNQQQRHMLIRNRKRILYLYSRPHMCSRRMHLLYAYVGIHIVYTEQFTGFFQDTLVHNVKQVGLSKYSLQKSAQFLGCLPQDRMDFTLI